MAVKRRSVPCDGCTACCRHELVIMHPEDGDDPSQYLTRRVVNPLTGAPEIALMHRPDGSCVYLGDSGCTIHDKAPVICRAFDCRGIVRRLRQSMPADLFETMVMHSDTLSAGVQMLRKGKK